MGCQFGVPGGTYPPKKYPSAPPPGALSLFLWALIPVIFMALSPEPKYDVWLWSLTASRKILYNWSLDIEIWLVDCFEHPLNEWLRLRCLSFLITFLSHFPWPTPPPPPPPIPTTSCTDSKSAFNKGVENFFPPWRKCSQSTSVTGLYFQEKRPSERESLIIFSQ